MIEDVNHLHSTNGGGEQMLNHDKWSMVRALAKTGCSVRKIARELGIDRNTVRKVLKQKEFQPYHRKVKKTSLIEPYIPFIQERVLQVDFNATRIYEELKNKGYSGSYSMVKIFIRPLREAAKQVQIATMRFETPPGKQAQMDWGSTWVMINGESKRIHIFVLILGYSRVLYAEFTEDQRLPALISCHEHAFDWFGGLPEEILYDNPKTIVLRRENGNISFNSQFEDFARYYGFNIRVCQPYRAQTKGKIEAGVKYVKRSFVLGREFSSMEDANEQLQHWIRDIADQRIHGTTHQKPAERFLEEKLRSIGSKPPYVLQDLYLRKVPTDCLVSFETNRYSVPWQYVHQEVEIHPGPDNLIRIYNNGNLIAQHERIDAKYKIVIDQEHYHNIFKKSESNPIMHWEGVNPEVQIRNLSVYEAIGGVSNG